MKFIAAAVQMLASADKAENIAQAAQWIRAAAAQGALVISLPEVFIWRGEKKDEWRFAEPIGGATTQALASLARELHIYLLGGSILEEIPNSRKVFNTSLLFDPRGRLVATYRKIHLFDVEIEGGVTAKESATREFGSEIVVAETGIGRMGLTICYDLRFPELYRALAARGAQLIFIPSAFTAYTGRAHWEPLLRARAIENQVYVVAPNQFGTNPKSFETHGRSMIIDPWGKILSEAPDGSGIVIAEVDFSYLNKIRSQLPALSHRRL